jgi:hypothetical protein
MAQSRETLRSVVFERNTLRSGGKISEAFNNKTNIDYNRYLGVANDGTKIEMRLDNLGNISTGYIVN